MELCYSPIFIAKKWRDWKKVIVFWFGFVGNVKWKKWRVQGREGKGSRGVVGGERKEEWEWKKKERVDFWVK